MFLTLEDPRARVQGSRDPLGVQPVWARFGRHVVTNLSTVSNSVRGFTILLLARYYTERLIEKGTVSEKAAISVFLRMEQIGAYARHIAHGVTSDIRGIERVKRFFAEHRTSVPIQDESSAWILSDQKVYGLWGLFSVPARVSGLIADGPVGLTAYARDFVEEEYAPVLRPVESKLLRLLAKGGSLKTNRADPVFCGVVDVLPERLSRPEKSFYGETLRDGSRVAGTQSPGRQARLARLLVQHTDLAKRADREEVLALARVVRPEDAGLAQCLERIGRLEALLAPCEAIYDYLQARHGQEPSTVAKSLRDRFGGQVPNLDGDGFGGIEAEIVEVVGPDLAGVMGGVDAALAIGDYEAAVRQLLKWNELVMAGRGAAPWIRLTDGRLDVRYRGRETELPARDHLPNLWRNAYFLDALKDITRQVESH